MDGGWRGIGKLLFVVDLPADVGQRGAPDAGLERQPHANDFQRVCEKDRGHAGQGTGGEAPEPRLLVFRADNDGAVLLVCDELDGCVGIDLE